MEKEEENAFEYASEREEEEHKEEERSNRDNALLSRWGMAAFLQTRVC